MSTTVAPLASMGRLAERGLPARTIDRGAKRAGRRELEASLTLSSRPGNFTDPLSWHPERPDAHPLGRVLVSPRPRGPPRLRGGAAGKADRLTSWRLRSADPCPPAHSRQWRTGRVDPDASRSGTLFDSRGGAVRREKKTMFNLEWLRARGRQPRGAGPAWRARPAARCPRLLLVASRLLETGCQSGPSRCGSGLFGPAASSAAPRAGSCGRSAMARPRRAAAPNAAPMADASPAACRWRR